MPLTKVNCCVSGEPVPLDECLSHARSRENSCPFTAELLAAMYGTVQSRGEQISTTALTAKCVRGEFLKRTLDYTVEPSSLYAAFRGTMFHGQLEHHAAPGTVPEARYFADVPGVGPLSCSPDLVDVEHGILYDYKFTKEVPRWDRPWPDHVEQVQINRWVVDHAHTVTIGAAKHSLDSDTKRALYVPRGWNELVLVYMDDKGAKPLVVTESIDVPKVGGVGTKKARVPSIWPDEQVLALITERYTVLADAFASSELPPIPAGWEGQSHVLCGYCPARSECREAEVEELIAAHLGGH